MKTVSSRYSYKFEIKKSTFISYLTPFSDFETVLNILRSEHKKANHIAWAYRYLNENNQIVENQTDDGEPKGTAGKPILHVLNKQDIINAGLLVVRYFGGIKLGANGLVKAYSEAAVKVIASSNLILYEKKEEYEISINYNNISKLEYDLKYTNFEILEKFFNDKGAKYLLSGTENDKNILIKAGWNVLEVKK